MTRLGKKARQGVARRGVVRDEAMHSETPHSFADARWVGERAWAWWWLVPTVCCVSLICAQVTGK